MRVALEIRSEVLGTDSNDCAACLCVLADVLSKLSRSLAHPNLAWLV